MFININIYIYEIYVIIHVIIRFYMWCIYSWLLPTCDSWMMSLLYSWHTLNISSPWDLLRGPPLAGSFFTWLVKAMKSSNWWHQDMDWIRIKLESVPTEVTFWEPPTKFHGRVTWTSIKNCSVTTCPGWWLTYPSEKYARQLGWLFPTEWKVIKFHGSSHHQPVILAFQLLTIINHY